MSRHIKIVRLTPFDMRCIEEAILYVDKHYESNISADQLAIEVSLSKGKLQAGFQQKTKLTLHKYIWQVRLEKAKKLLVTTNEPVKKIAAVTGFYDESHFCKVFKRLTTISPVEYRLQQAI